MQHNKLTNYGFYWFQIIGLAAKAGLFRNGAVSVIHNKRLMNKDIDSAELELALKSSPSKLIQDAKNLYYSIKNGENNDKITPADISTMIFETMYDISTTAAHDDEEHNVVLCTPLRFSSASIKSWSQSAQAAGFKVLQTIGEPTATCLAHGIGKDKKKTEWVIFASKFFINWNIIGSFWPVSKNLFSTLIGTHFFWHVFCSGTIAFLELTFPPIFHKQIMYILSKCRIANQGS